jgi:hypothetical protein
MAQTLFGKQGIALLFRYTGKQMQPINDVWISAEDTAAASSVTIVT